MVTSYTGICPTSNANDQSVFYDLQMLGKLVCLFRNRVELYPTDCMFLICDSYDTITIQAWFVLQQNNELEVREQQYA